MQQVTFLPHYVNLFGLELSQTLIASVICTILFLLLVVCYMIIKKSNPSNKFVWAIDMIMEGMYSFYKDIAWHDVWSNVVWLIVWLFLYVVWVNLWWVVWDLFALAIPSFHSYFRPVASDITFNAALAAIFVIWSLVYWFYKNGFHFIEKYIPYKWLGLVQVTNIWTALLKPLDIIVWLFVGIIEIIWEVARIMSLSLRLFGNILAGIVLVWLIVRASESIFWWQIWLPIVVVMFEAFVSILQGFVFSMLVLVYFKMAWSGWH